MASLQITIDIAEEPVEGHSLDKLAAKFNPSVAAIVDRIGQANQAAYPNHRYDAVDVLVKAIVAAVAVAEAAVVPE